MSETEVRRRVTEFRRRMQDKSGLPIRPFWKAAASRRTPKGNPPGGPARRSTSTNASLVELLIVYPDNWSAACAAIVPSQIASSALRRIYETGCRLLESGVLPDFGRLILEFDDPSLKSLLVDLDEQGRAKGSGMAEPAELFSDLLKRFRRRRWISSDPANWSRCANKTWPKTRRSTCSRTFCSRKKAGRVFLIPWTGDDTLARAIPCYGITWNLETH